MVEDLCYGAKKYMLPHLLNKCNNYVLSVVSPKNVCRAYKISCLFEEKTLANKCIEIISTNTEEVLNDSSFEDMEFSTLMTVLSLDHLNVDSELDLFFAVERYAKAQELRTQDQISPPEDGGQPSKKLSELKLDPPMPEEKALSLNVESSPAVVLDAKKPTEITSQADSENVKVPERPIREALQKIRFLSLTAQQFAEGPALSDLLTKKESFALLMNIASADSAVRMPPGFSGRREPRQPRSNSVPT